MLEQTILPVFLRQNRNYVQGTQMIARAAERLSGSDWFLDQAQFQAISDRLITLANTPSDTAKIVGQVKFTRGSEQCIYYFKEMAEPAPQSDLAMPIQVKRLCDTNHAATYSFSDCHTFEDVLNVVVQSLRSEHQLAFPGSYDIWLSGARNFRLAVDISHDSGKGTIQLVRQRVMASADVQQSLWSISLEDNNKISSGFITFAFKTKT